MNETNVAPKESVQTTEDKFSWIYLINLVFYFIPLVLNGMPAWKIGLSLSVLIPFIYCYFWAYRSPRNKAITPILAMVSLAALITPINPGSLSLFTFAGFFIGFYYPLNRALLGFLALIALLGLLNVVIGFNHYYFVGYGSMLIASIGLIGIARRKQVETQSNERQSQAEISQLATMLERERIARDLHDIMGHNLSSISLKAELAEKLLDKNELTQAQVQLKELNQIARDSLSQIRQTVSGYKHKGLTSSVMLLCQTLRDKGLSVSLEGDIPQLKPKVETQIILSLTELCNNVIRHSQADHCAIRFSESATEISLNVADNGKADAIKEGNGLNGIKERLAEFQGRLDYSLNQGSNFSITIPKQGNLAE
ncbi:sensor histidine kinase [Shewanella sp. D64]|uniref:sensor histidine kinase n=1 Tax=unclassified Shewanella TaxID=196818 RepID=UPI0022BA145D|nr:MULTISPECIES: sensor histidine kinase [unclassified Shewanella]MEC4726843.1 sensor histidine kinase [Shewanella sp. D64]MEC4739045.1 sensor histidine kinase [Shewanella sp. E94]WBJ98061.1 sensor histidine kinase [Shewanella sp. MTB7]